MSSPSPTELLEFRVATVADIEAIHDLVNRVFRGESGLKSWTGEAHLLSGQRVDRAMIDEILRTPKSAILLAEKRNDGSEPRLVGCVHIKHKVNVHSDLESESQARVAYLGMLTVDVELQRRGLGQRLLNAAESFARRELNASVMEMTVIAIRTELVEWYERRGYRRTGEQRPFPYEDTRYGIPLRHDLDFVVLQKDI